MALEQVRAALVAAGLDPAELAWGDEVREHRWTVREEAAGSGAAHSGAAHSGVALCLGGHDHGEWRTWREFTDDDGGVDELVKALWDIRRRVEPARIGRTLAETSRAATLGVEMMDRSASWSGRDELVTELPATEVKVGTPFDHVGDESGHVLHHYGTPWERRALPEGDHALPVTGYLLVHQLPLGCRVERIPASNGQPGGAWRVVLDRPIAAFVDSGGLRPFLPKDA